MINCVFFNARSLVNKLTDLHYLLYTSNFDLIIVVESWLTDSLPDGFLDPRCEYAIFRFNRMSRGGGVCIFAARTILATQVELVSPFDSLEIVVLDVVHCARKFRLIAAYRPPCHGPSSIQSMSSLVECLRLTLHPCRPTFIVGDFNCPTIDWFAGIPPVDKVQDLFYNFVTDNGLTQAVLQATHLDNILDLLITNEPLLLSRVDVCCPFSTGDHNSIQFSIMSNGKFSRKRIAKTYRYCWRKADFVALSAYLSNVDWQVLFSSNFTADSLWDAFCVIIDEAIDLFVPKVQSSRSRRAERNKQYPRHIMRLSAKKRCLWRMKRSRPASLLLADKYRATTQTCRDAIFRHECSIENAIINDNDLGSFYRYVNGKLACSSGVATLRTDTGATVTNDVDKANLLNTYFSSVCTQDDGVLPPFPLRVPVGVKKDSIAFTPDILVNSAKKVKSKYTCGPGGYPTIFLRNTIHSLSFPLSVLFQSFLEIGRTPTAWKSAYVTPIFKKGASSNPSNYRPISLTNIFCKLMERVVANEMLNYLRTHELISANQHGFLSRHSTGTNLLETLNDWTITLDNKSTHVAAYIDFAKAFDTVSRPKLLHKLIAYGLSGNLFNWIADLLSDRSQCTRVGSALSSSAPLNSGVVQGSCMGPLLFIIFINDICDDLTDSVTGKLYADDLKLYTSVDDFADIDGFQFNLSKICQWSTRWQLAISYSKCCTISVGGPLASHQYILGSNSLVPVTKISDLGVTFDTNLKFRNHIHSIAAKGHQRANLILRCFLTKDPATLTRAFVTYVRPMLEYCSAVWSPSLVMDINSIEAVQRRFTKRFPGLRDVDYHSRLLVLGLDSLELRRLRADLILVYKIVFGLIDLKFSDFFTWNPNRNSRGHTYSLFKPRCALEVRKRFFSHRVIAPWNSLDPLKTNFRSLHTFKLSLQACNLSSYIIF
jgi:ribonuclease P/MRP protein subunit RPP40